MVAFVLTGDPVQIVIREGPYAGVEAEVLTDVPLGVTAAIGRWLVTYGQAEAGSQDEAIALQTVWTLFSEHVLTGWNLYDRTGVVPADASAFQRVSPRFITQLLELWADLVTTQSPPAEEPDGE